MKLEIGLITFTDQSSKGRFRWPVCFLLILAVLLDVISRHRLILARLSLFA